MRLSCSDLPQKRLIETRVASRSATTMHEQIGLSWEKDGELISVKKPGETWLICLTHGSGGDIITPFIQITQDNTHHKVQNELSKQERCLMLLTARQTGMNLSLYVYYRNLKKYSRVIYMHQKFLLHLPKISRGSRNNDYLRDESL